MEKLAGFTKEIFLGKEYKNPQELAGYLKMTADKLSIFLEKNSGRRRKPDGDRFKSA
jgi:hypothetical protein